MTTNERDMVEELELESTNYTFFIVAGKSGTTFRRSFLIVRTTLFCISAWPSAFLILFYVIKIYIKISMIFILKYLIHNILTLNASP